MDKKSFKLPDQPDRSDQSDQSDQPNFFRRHLHAVVIAGLVILLTVAWVIIDRMISRVQLTLPATGLVVDYQTDKNNRPIPTDRPVRILSYNADIGSPNDLLYYIDTVATITPENLDDNNTDNDIPILAVDWDIPDSARYRSTYTEICILDDGIFNKKVNSYCVDAVGDSPATPDLLKPEFYKISCTYYLPAHSVGLLAWFSGWFDLDEHQLVGCAGSAQDNGEMFGDESFLNSHYGFSNGDISSTTLAAGTGRDLSGLTMENFFQSILNAENSPLDAGDIITNSLSNNFVYNRNTQQIDLRPTGVAMGNSCSGIYQTTINRPAPVNGSDNSTTTTYTCIPVFSVDRWGRLTNVTSRFISYDAVSGNEVVGVTGSRSGLIRAGSGTTLDPYTLAVSINLDGFGGLKTDTSGRLAVVAPQCTTAQDPQIINPANNNMLPGNAPDTTLNKLQWTYENPDGTINENGRFICVHDVDDQQLSIDNTYINPIGPEQGSGNNNNVGRRTYTVALSGDNASSIQFIDQDTIYTQFQDRQGNLTDGLTVNNINHTLAVNAPYCSNYQKLLWQFNSSLGVGSSNGHYEYTYAYNSVTGTYDSVKTWVAEPNDAASVFKCVYTTDRILRGGEIGYVNDLNNGLTIVDNNDGTTTISITETGVIAGHFGNAWLGGTSADSNGVVRPDSTEQIDPTNTTTFKLPVFTVNAQGQIVGIQNQTITKTRLSDTDTSGLTLVGDGSVAAPYQYSINLTSDGGIVKGGSGQLGTTDQLELKSCPAGYILASKGLGQGYDCFHVDDLEDVNQSYHAGISLSQAIDWQACTPEVFGSGHCYDPNSGVWNSATLVWNYTPCTSYNSPANCSYQAGGTFNTKYDASRGLTITSDADTGKLAINLGDVNNTGTTSGLKFDATNGNRLMINAPTCTPTSTSIPANATATDKSGRLTWTGTAFDCQRITDSAAGTYGSLTKNASDVVAADTIQIPVITVDNRGEISLGRMALTATGNDGIKITNGAISLDINTDKGLILSNNQLAVNIGGTNNTGAADSGMKFDNGVLKVNAAVCGGNTQVLTWTNNGFNCVSGTDFFLKANNEAGTGQQIADNGIVNFNNGTGTVANRSGNSISYSLATTGGSTAPANCDATNASTGGYGGTVYLPQLTVDVYGRVTSVTCGSITLPAAQTLRLTGNSLSIMDGSTATNSINIPNGVLTINSLGSDCTNNFSANQAGSTTIICGNLTFTAGSGLAVNRSGNTVSYGVNAPICNEFQYLTYSGSQFVCADFNTSYVPKARTAFWGNSSCAAVTIPATGYQDCQLSFPTVGYIPAMVVVTDTVNGGGAVPISCVARTEEGSFTTNSAWVSCVSNDGAEHIPGALAVIAFPY